MLEKVRSALALVDVPTITLTPEATLDWLALRLVPGLGTRSAIRLLKRLKSPTAIFRSSPSELQAAGLSGTQAQNVANGCSYDDAIDQQVKMMAAGVQLITINDPLYPQRLREVFDPPLVLFARGRTELLKAANIAVVGTRRASPYGLAVAERLSGDLAKAGLAIVSGMARGIDTAAHRAALAVDGDTIAVFGCGVDVLYPTENRKLYQEIGAKGLMISEFPMEAPAYPQNFPIRNRIVSGLSLGVLIVEGAQYSGSSITAKLAMDQGRDVFAVPGNITCKMSWGPNLLIRQGAKLVQEWSDVTNELPEEVRRDLVSRAREKYSDQSGLLFAAPAEEPQIPQKVLAQKVLSVLKVDQPQQLDLLLASFEDFSSSELIGALFDLEMSGLVRQLPGRHFIKVW